MARTMRENQLPLPETIKSPSANCKFGFDDAAELNPLADASFWSPKRPYGELLPAGPLHWPSPPPRERSRDADLGELYPLEGVLPLAVRFSEDPYMRSARAELTALESIVTVGLTGRESACISYAPVSSCLLVGTQAPPASTARS